MLAWLGVVVLVDPLQTGAIGRGMFAVSLLILLVGVWTLLVTWVYRKGLGDKEAAHHLGGAFRQALLLAFYTAGIIFFQYAGILTWWDALLLLVVVLLTEFSWRRLVEEK
jgi:predicted membrane-bound mannosyltransferase